MNIVICEDDIPYQNYIKDILTKYIEETNSNAVLTLVTNNSDDVIDYIKNNSEVTLYYLDIKLNSSMTGIELAAHIRENDFYSNIIFITNYPEFVQTTYDYRVEALDYIIKDNSEDMRTKICSGLELVEKRQSRGYRECLNIENKQHSFSIPYGCIYYIESIKSSHKLSLYHDNGIITFYCLLKDLDKKLDNRFVRCHKSVIVNKDKIFSVDKKNHMLTMQGGLQCVYSPKYKGLIEYDI